MFFFLSFLPLSRTSLTPIRPNERTFSVEMTEEIQELQKGDVVTYSFDGYANDGLPLNPAIKRPRIDVTWEDVLQNHSTIVVPSGKLNFSCRSLSLFSVLFSFLFLFYFKQHAHMDIGHPKMVRT